MIAKNPWVGLAPGYSAAVGGCTAVTVEAGRACKASVNWLSFRGFPFSANEEASNLAKLEFKQVETAS